jgi:hypothetical protein
VAALLLVTGCHSLKLTPPVVDAQNKTTRLVASGLPNKYTIKKDQFLFRSNVELKEDAPLLRELVQLPEQVAGQLELPRSKTPIYVYLFEDRDRYEEFMHGKYPNLPKRRAFFVALPHTAGGGEDLLVYTFWGERVREDLRHELTHALLHSVLRDVPLWLDEGLAEYFEVPPEANGFNPRHLEQIRLASTSWFKADLPHLEQLTEVQQMTPAEYREAWAWVHLMLHNGPESRSVLISYLALLRTNPSPGPLAPRLSAVFPQLTSRLEKHLSEVQSPESSLPEK